MIKFSLFLLIISFLTACSHRDNVVNVYSGRHYSSDEELFRKFTAKTGIKVNLVKADSDQLINRILVEAERSPADLFITADVSRLSQAKKLDLLQPIPEMAGFLVIPSNLRDPDWFWLGLTKRARVIVYHKQRVDITEINDYEDLAEEIWSGRVVMRSSQSHYNQSLLASMVAAAGKDAAEAWVKELVRNFANDPKGNDRDQVKAIAAAEGDLSLVNTYYLGLLLRSDNAAEREVASSVGIIFPNQSNRGTHINVSGIALTANAPNRDNALRLIEFLLNKESQEYLSVQNFEYPVLPEAAWPELLLSWGKFKEDPINLNTLNDYLPDAMLISSKAGWK